MYATIRLQHVEMLQCRGAVHTRRQGVITAMGDIDPAPGFTRLQAAVPGDFATAQRAGAVVEEREPALWHGRIRQGQGHAP